MTDFLQAIRGIDLMEFVHEFFILRSVSQTRMPANATTRDSLIALLGADLQHVVSPLKQRICETARTMHGDYHRAALQLLADDQGRWRPAFEQQLILAALADLQRAPEAVAIVAAVRN